MDDAHIRTPNLPATGRLRRGTMSPLLAPGASNCASASARALSSARTTHAVKRAKDEDQASQGPKTSARERSGFTQLKLATTLSKQDGQLARRSESSLWTADPIAMPTRVDLEKSLKPPFALRPLLAFKRAQRTQASC